MPDSVDKNKANIGARTISGLMWSFSGHGFQLTLQFITLVVLARLITPAEFGVVAAAMIVIRFSELISQMGVGSAIVQRKELLDGHQRAAVTLSWILGLSFSVIGYNTADLMGRFFQMATLPPILRVLSVIFFINCLRIVAESLLQRDLKFRKIATANVVSYAAGFALCGIPAAVAGLGAWALVIANLVQALTKTVLMTRMRRHPMRPVRSRSFHTDLLYMGGGFTAARLGNFIAVEGDNFVIGRVLGAEALGFYSRAYQLMLMPIKLFGRVLDSVLFPAMALIQDDAEKLSRVYLQGAAMVALLTLPASGVLVVLAPEVVIGLLGPQWEATIAPFQVLAFVMFFRTAYRMSDSLAKATGMVMSRARRQWIYAAFVLSGAYVGSSWGLAGVAVGVALAMVLNFFLMAALCLGRLDVTWSRFLAIHAPAIASTVVATGVAWLIASQLRVLTVPPLVVAGAGGIAAFLVLGVLMRLLPGVFMGSLVREVGSRLTRHLARRKKNRARPGGNQV